MKLQINNPKSSLPCIEYRRLLCPMLSIDCVLSNLCLSTGRLHSDLHRHHPARNSAKIFCKPAKNFFFVKSEIFDAGCFKFEKCTFLRLCLVCGVQKYLSSAAVRGSSVLGGLGQLGQTELSRSLCLDWRLEITTSHHVLCVSHITRYLSLREKETSLASAQPIPKEMQNM